MMHRQVVAGALVAVMCVPALPLRGDGPTIRCESGSRGRYTECRVDTQGEVRLVREFSNGRCEKWRSWGYDRRWIWVKDGCRAEFRVGHEGITKGEAAVAGAVVGAALLAAILASKNHDDKAPDAVAPDWARGRFRGFDPSENVELDIRVERDGKINGTADGNALTGYMTKDATLVLGSVEFTVRRESWGFSATDRRNPDTVVYFRKQ